MYRLLHRTGVCQHSGQARPGQAACMGGGGWCVHVHGAASTERVGFVSR
jgi:hypothetical protein